MENIEIPAFAKHTSVTISSDINEIQLILDYDVSGDLLLKIAGKIKDAIDLLPLNHISLGDLNIKITWENAVWEETE